MKWWQVSLIACVCIGGVLSLFASGAPDGLERVAHDHGFIDREAESSFEIIPDYSSPGIDNELIATSTAGIIGVMVMFVLVYSIGNVLKKHETG